LTSAVIPVLEKRNKRLPLFRTVVPTAVDLNRFQLIPRLPSKIKALFSGTYNDYYDLHLSALFMDELRIQIETVTHWARPYESSKRKINVGEERILPAK
jgi:hypothetical protein